MYMHTHTHTHTKVCASAKLTLGGADWHIWKGRNRRVFHLEELTKLQRFHQLQADVKILLQKSNLKLGDAPAHIQILQNWDVG